MPKKIGNAKDEFTDYLARRLETVTIESRDASDVIETYDTPSAFHFVDPPYVNSDCGHYEGFFNEDDLVRLLKLLSDIEGKFMLTMFPHDSISQFATDHDWTIHKVERTISASKTTRRKQEEWIICNYRKAEGVQSLFD